MKVKYVTLIFIMLFLSGCATMKTQFVDQAGRAMPEPHYALKVVGQPMYVTFYYTAFETITDLDGSEIAKPAFFPFMKTHDIFAEKYQSLTLTIEVNNPTSIEYSLYERKDMKVGKAKTEMQTGGEIKRSNLEYRQFVIQLPYGEEVRFVDHLIILQIDEKDVMQIGSFRYNLIH